MIRWCEAVRSLRGWRRGGLALVAGVLTALPLPPFDLWPLLFLGVPLAVLLLQGVTGRRQAFWTGWLYGLGYFGFAFHWIGYAFLVDAETYLWMMPFMVGGLAAGMAIYWGLAALAAKVLGLDGVRLALGFPALLAIAEWLRGHLFTGFPWAAPGLAVDGMGALAQAASLVGMTGLTLLLTLWAAMPLLWLSTGHRRLAMTGERGVAFLLDLPEAVPLRESLDTLPTTLGRWKAVALPTTFVVDRRGRLRGRLTGGADWESGRLVGQLEALMTEP